MANLDLADVIISQEELDRLEQEDPLNAFAFVMKNDVLFSKSSGKSSNVSTDAPSETSKENLLAEFRDKVLKVIEQDESVIDEVKGLLHKLCELSSGSNFKDLSQMLGPLLDSINQSFREKKIDQANSRRKHNDAINFWQMSPPLMSSLKHFDKKLQLFDKRWRKLMRPLQNIRQKSKHWKTKRLIFWTKSNL